MNFPLIMNLYIRLLSEYICYFSKGYICVRYSWAPKLFLLETRKRNLVSSQDQGSQKYTMNYQNICKFLICGNLLGNKTNSDSGIYISNWLVEVAQ